MIYIELDFAIFSTHAIECTRFNAPTPSSETVIAIHGFAGTRKSKTILNLAEKLNKSGIEVVSFDLPGHGNSELDGSQLTVSNCLDDIETVYNHITALSSDKPISIFATSFGAYLALLYTDRSRHKFKNIVLRCPAIDMYSCMSTLLNNNPNEITYPVTLGYNRKIDIYKEFIEELKENNVFEEIALNKNNITIIHGVDDSIAPIEMSRKAAEINKNIKLIEIPNCEHVLRDDDGGKQLNEIMTIAYNEFVK